MAEQKEYLRFSVAQRFEHWVLVMCFTLLALTGLPQKFAGDGWAESLIGLLGGIETVRVIHHTAAAVLSLAIIYHIIAVAYKVFVLRVRWTMFPRLDDVIDALDAVRYNLGLTKEQPKLNRYGFAEKAEYWALVWGTVIMAITGFIMWNPINAAHFLPGDMIPTSKAAHGAEAILAVLAVILWHFYSVHVKTLNKSMFTGKITDHQMQHEHALELEQINQAKADVRPSPDVIKKRERIFIPVATAASVVMLVILYLFISYEGTALTTLPRRVSPVQVFVPITPTPTRAASGSTASAIALPADHAGRTVCLACHANGTGPALPADHAGRTDATCSVCHKLGSTTAPAGTAAPTTSATATPGATAVPTKPASAAPTSAPAASTGPKPQPADHAGRIICNACHANGAGPAEPTDHAGRTDATCSACHVASSATAQPTSTSATVAPTKAAATSAPAASTGPKPQPANHAGRTACTTCHANGVGPAEPADHAGRTDATCSACHLASAAATPSPTKPTGQPTSASASGASTTVAAAQSPATAATAASAITTLDEATASGKDTCLACHGPFEKLEKSAASFVAPSGETTSPHRIVPHNSTSSSAVPECTHCHAVHPVPPTGKIDLSTVSVDWCYTSCHHQNNFTPCDKCHID